LKPSQHHRDLMKAQKLVPGIRTQATERQICFNTWLLWCGLQGYSVSDYRDTEQKLASCVR